MPIVNAWGKLIQAPDDMSHEEIEKIILANEKDLNPDYKPPKSSSVREFVQDNILGFDISRKPSIAEQAEATADEGANTAAPQVKGAPVRQSFYNKALLNDSIGVPVTERFRKPDINGVLARTRKAADEDIKGQDFQRELEGLRTDGNIQESPSGVTGLLGNVITGAKQTGRMAAATVSALANDNKEVEGIAKESNLSAEENTPTEQKALLGDLRKINREQDAFDQISDTLKSAANNPMGTGQMVAEQLPNTAVSLASGFAGFKAGGAAGAVFGPIGATIGGTLGFVSGMFLGNVLLEAGGKAIEKASDEDGFTPEDRDSALREGAVKAGVITGVDAATFKLGGMLARKIGASAINAGARAEAKVLIDAGVDATSLSAINAALKTSPELLKAAKVAGERAALQSLSTGRKAAILGTGAALETVGEFVGEAGGEYAATGKADYVDATIEALSSATMSIAETAYNYNKVASGNDLSPEGIQKAVNSINDAETKSKINDIRNAATVDQAINAANESVSQKPVDKDDVLRVADPTLADIERLTGLKPSEAIQTAQDELQRQSQAAQQNNATGSDIEIVLPDNKTLKARWDVVDADNVKASLKNGVSQPRDRTRAASDVQIQEIANQPDYRRLADSPVMDIGAPVISNDGQIVGGNGRFEALSRAYDQGTHKDYLERLKQDAINKGIDPAILDTMRKPVLVRRISEPFDTRQLAIASNSGMSAAYSDLEQAKIDAERLKGIDEIITADNGDIVMTGDNVRRVRDALGGYNAAEIASFVDDQGQLSQQGIKRIRNAMLAKAYGDNPVLGKIIESTDSDIKTILGSLTRVAGDVVKARATAPKESDITPNLLDAINIFSQLKQKGQSVTNYLSQQDAFTEKLDPVTENVLLFLDKNSRSQPKVTQYIRDAYTKQGAIDATSPDMFGQEPPKVKDIFAKPTIEEELEKHLKKNGYDFDVRPIDQRDINALDDTKKAQKDVAEKQAKIFNKKIVFVKAKGEFGINGVMVPAIKDTIFINIETPKPFHAVMAHELSHWMEQEHPSVYKDMLGSLKDVIVNEEGYRKKYGITEQDEGLIQKEIAADLMGDNFTDETFWNKVAAANPDKWKEIAKRIIQWLKNTILKAKSRGMGSEDWVTDAKKAQDIIANAVAQYTKQQDAVGKDIKFHKAFHGSPHDHNKFDSSKIGTGEGAQAYGYGHYFTDSKEVAEWYKDKFEQRDSSWVGGDLLLYDRDYVSLALQKGYSVAEFKNNQEKLISPLIEPKKALKVFKEFNRGGIPKTKSKLYEVELAPEQDEYLLWDKPLSEQSEKVRLAISNKGIVLPEYWTPENTTGEKYYRYISKGDGSEWASQFLHSLGIRGIKYLDGSSRAKGEGAYNYVIFDDNDISITAKFSKAEKTLIAQHNLSVRNLIHADRMGALAVPSIAITDKAHPLTGFGEITLLADEDFINNARTFGADIYSTRYPEVSYDFSNKDVQRLNDQFKAEKSRLGESEFYSNSMDDPHRIMKESPAVAMKFLESEGIKPRIKLVTPEEKPAANVFKWVKSSLDRQELVRDLKFIDDVKKDYIAKFKDVPADEMEGILPENDDQWRNLAVRKAFEVTNYRESLKNKGKVDLGATGRALTEQIRLNKRMYKFNAYIDNIITEINPKQEIFDKLTNTGSGRKYIEHNLDNVIRKMRSSFVGGESFGFGLGKIRGVHAPEFKSIEQIRKNKHRLMSGKDFDAIKEDVGKELDELVEKVNRYGTYSGFDNVNQAIFDSAKMGIPKALAYNGFKNVPDDIKSDIAAFIEKLRNMPTEYFEAKVLRGVKLGEFKAAIVPKDIPQEALDILKKNGIEDIRKYKSGDNEDRVKQINKVTHVMFSRAPKLYSKLEQALEAANDKVFSTGPQVKLWLQSNASKLGIKKDEIYWSGIDNWLDAQGKVSKQQVVEFVRQNGVKVEDVILDDSGIKDVDDVAFMEYDDELGKWVVYSQFIDGDFRTDDKSEAKQLYDSLIKEHANPTKHNNEKLTLPGGTDYKELVVIVPSVEEYNKSDTTHFGDTGQGKQIGWIRMNTRNGGLFIEELQSQRAQQGRSKGFVNKFSDDEMTRYRHLSNRAIGNFANSEYREPLSLQERAELISFRNRREGVPPAPFVSDANQKATNAYITLLMKKALIEAVSNDHTSVSWTTGDQQADRYDLSKQISMVSAISNKDGTYNLIVEDKSGNEINPYSRSGKKVTPSEMEEVIGKDLTKKVVTGADLVKNKPWPKNASVNPAFYTVRGVDLKIGGEWAQSMYGDEQGLNAQGKPSLMTQAANDIFKHVGSGKVESINGQPGFYITPEMKNKDLPLFSVREVKPFNPNEDIPETKFQKAQRIGQDKFNRFRVIKEWLAKEKGINLSEAADVYGAETRYYGKVANQQEDFRNKVRDPLVEKIAKAGFKLDDVEQYLLNRHAQEANVQNRKLTGKSDSTAYGISDEGAEAYLAKAPKELAKLADEVQAITKATQQLRLDNGIENQERIEAMNAAYQYYIPVRGGAEEQAKQQGSGKGLSVKYKPKRRLGHELRNESVIENIFQDYERAIIEVEKNRVGKSLALMAAEIQMPELISINQPVKRKVLKTDTAFVVEHDGEIRGVFNTMPEAQMFKKVLEGGLFEGRPSSNITINKTQDQHLIYSASPMLADNEVLVYMDGHEVRLQINDELLAQAYKNMGMEPLGSILSVGRAINGWMSKVYTAYNPEFFAVNVLRDFTSGMINLTGEQGIGISSKAIANYPKAFSSLLKYATTGQSDRWIDAYRDNGGNTGAAYLSDLERLGEEVRKEYASYQGVIANLKEKDVANALRAAGRKVFNATIRYMENLNQAGENAFRLATFKAMVESGKSAKESGSMAKNVTVNFNRKGEVGAQMNALYLFFNASIQGTAAASHALFKGKNKYQAWGLAGSMMTLGYIAASMLGGFDDEDKYDSISDFVKSRNLIISYGDGYVKIPVPYGHGFFYNAGRMYAEAQRKDEIGKLPYQLAALAIEEFSPFNIAQSEDSSFDSRKVTYGLIPTAIRIPVEITNNYSTFTGRELYPEKAWYKSEPDNEKMFRGTKGTVYDVSAQYLASIGVEISPETLKYLSRTATGGAGAFVDSTVSAAMLKKQGAELDTREIPFVRKFYGEATIQDARARYNKAKEEAREAYEKFNALRKKNDLVSVRNYLNDKKELIALNSYANKMSDVIKNIRDQQDLIKLSEDFTVAEKRLKIKELEKQEEYYYDLFLNRHKKVKGR